MDYQIINGKKFPQFPFYGKSNYTDNIYKVVGIIEPDKFSATNGSEKGFLYRNDVTPVSITEIIFDEQPTEKKYRPWTSEEVGSLLFFKNMIFRRKDYDNRTLIALSYDNSFKTVKIQNHLAMKLSDVFNVFEYSTDGETWLPCGVEI